MQSAFLPANEVQRLAALHALAVMDTAPEAEFDALVNAAAAVCGMPISLISLIDTDRQWFKANHGLRGATQTPRDIAFCAHAILQDDVFEVTDALADPRFADNPLVAQAPDIRFYAGAPLRLSDGTNAGTLCVLDWVPRKLSEQQREVLRLLSIAAVHALESRKMACAFVASETQFRTLIAASPLGVFATDAAGAFTYTNACWRTIHGLGETEALGDGWSRTLNPDDKAAVIAGWQRCAALKLAFDMEFKVRRDDGTVREVRCVSSLVLDTAGEVTGYVGSVEDITERLLAGRARDHERQRLAAIIQGTGAGTWEWNVQTGETRFNERWAEIVGMTLDELSPTSIETWAALVHPQDLARSDALLRAHFSGELAAYEFEARVRHRDGHWVWVLDRGCVLTRTQDGQPEWMFGTHLDITARKLEEDKLRKSEELLNTTGALAQVGGWELDIASGRILLSAQTCRIHGVEPGYQPLLAEALDFYAPQARPVIEAALARAMADGQDWDLELPFIQRGGQRIWVRAVGHAAFEGSQPVRLLGAFQDITHEVLSRQELASTHERMSLATESGGIGVWELNLQTGALTWDAQMRSLHGMPEGLASEGYEFWARHLHPEDRGRAEREFQTALNSGTDFRSEFRVIWADGSVRFLRAAGRITRDTQGHALRMVGVNWDVTPLRRLSNELAEQHELLRVTLQSIGDAVITTDAESRVTWLNPAAERMTGWLSAEALGRPLGQVFHIVNEETRHPIEIPVTTCMQQAKTGGLTHHTVLVSRNGDDFGVEHSAAPIRNPNGNLLGVVLVFHDVTEQRRLSGEMSFRATHDSLTGLLNRADFEPRLQAALDGANADPAQVHALLCIDLDHFKIVNDTCGHAAGDRLLQQIARMLSDAVRQGDAVARLGGDEFAILLKGCSAASAQVVGQKICAMFDDFRFVHGEHRMKVGTSIGLVAVDSRWADTASLMQAADACCYVAKQGGRNRVVALADDEEHILHGTGDAQWASRIERALDEDRFVLHGQRIVPLQGDCIHSKFELLLRMVDVDGSLVPPGAFIPSAERFHLMGGVDRWVVRHAVDWLRGLLEHGDAPTVAINLSGQSVGDRSFHSWAIDVFADAGPAVCERLILEVTETAAVTNLADAAKFMGQARGLKLRTALDDFGAGASSFGYLKKLPLDYLKIDGQFVRDVLTDPLDAAAVRCFVDVARVVGLKTIAEFVENEAVLQHLTVLGVDFAQGFHIHKPGPLPAVWPQRGSGRKAFPTFATEKCQPKAVCFQL